MISSTRAAMKWSRTWLRWSGTHVRRRRIGDCEAATPAHLYTEKWVGAGRTDHDPANSEFAFKGGAPGEVRNHRKDLAIGRVDGLELEFEADEIDDVQEAVLVVVRQGAETRERVTRVDVNICRYG